MDELVTSNYSEYEALAYELATNKDKLSNIRRRLKEKKDLPFFDSDKFTNELEKIYTSIIWFNYLRITKPSKIDTIISEFIEDSGPIVLEVFMQQEQS